ncbi:MAG: curli production assembly/transport component CsgF [Bacteroidota bacterium]
MKKLILLFFICFGFHQMSQAQDLVYRPVNPAFGGDTFNYQWLLSSASEQDLLQDPRTQTTPGFNQGNQLDDFTNSLNRQLLSQLSRQLVSSQFGEEGLQEGSYSIGSFDINVENVNEGVSIIINDLSTGGQTQIIIPFF